MLRPNTGVELSGLPELCIFCEQCTIQFQNLLITLLLLGIGHTLSHIAHNLLMHNQNLLLLLLKLPDSGHQPK